MKLNTAVLVILILCAGFATVHFKYRNGTENEHREIVERLREEIERLQARLRQLEVKSATQVSVIAPRAMAPPESGTTGSSAAVTPDRFVDQPGPDQPSCTLATVKNATRLAKTLIWNGPPDEVFVGDLPAGSVVEILTPALYKWEDYPDEHGIFVKVDEAPGNPQIEGQVGYLELRQINNKSCNLGAEFDR